MLQDLAMALQEKAIEEGLTPPEDTSASTPDGSTPHTDAMTPSPAPQIPSRGMPPDPVSTADNDDETYDNNTNSVAQKEPATDQTIIGTVAFKSEILDGPQHLLPKVTLERLEVPSVPSPKVEPGDVIDARIIQEAVLKMNGPVVTLQALQNKVGSGLNSIREALQAMTYPDHSTAYVGQTVTITGDIDVFFKCPPQCLHPDALMPFDIQTGAYKQFFCNAPEETRILLQPWYTYVESMVVKCPFSHTMFPLENLGLDEREVRRLVKLKAKLEELQKMKAGTPKKN